MKSRLATQKLPTPGSLVSINSSGSLWGNDWSASALQILYKIAFHLSTVMKNTLLLCCCLVGLSASARKLKPTQVPVAVKTGFAQKFPAAKVLFWEKEAAGYEVKFRQMAAVLTAVFDAAGMWKETEESVSAGTLPEGVAAYLKEKRKGRKITETARITAADGTVTYEAEVGGTDYLFSEKGQFLRAVKD